MVGWALSSSYCAAVTVELDLENTTFTIYEGSSDPARVCARVLSDLECPIAFDAQISFISDRDSAGDYFYSCIYCM